MVASRLGRAPRRVRLPGGRTRPRKAGGDPAAAGDHDRVRAAARVPPHRPGREQGGDRCRRVRGGRARRVRGRRGRCRRQRQRAGVGMGDGHRRARGRRRGAPGRRRERFHGPEGGDLRRVRGAALRVVGLSVEAERGAARGRRAGRDALELGVLGVRGGRHPRVSGAAGLPRRRQPGAVGCDDLRVNPLVCIAVGTLVLEERLAPPTWHKVVAYAGLALALLAAVAITRATEDAEESHDVAAAPAVL